MMLNSSTLPLLTSREAAFALGAPNGHALAQQRHVGVSADYIKIGADVRYDPRELDRYKKSAADDTLLNQDDVSLWFGLTKEVIFALRQSGLPSHDVHGKVVFLRRDVEHFLRVQTRRPAFRVSVNIGNVDRTHWNVSELRFVPLLTDHQAARLLNKTVGTLENWRAAGRGPEYIKLGKAVRYEREDVVRYIRDVADRTRLTLDEISKWWAVPVDTVIECIRMENGPKARRLDRKTVIYRGEAELFLRSLVKTPQRRETAAA